MKKTKLLMPILGVAATLGAVVPTVVACGPKEEEVIGIDYEIKSTTAGNTIENISINAPKVVVGQDYIARFQWKEISGTTKKDVPSHAYQAKVYDANGEVVVENAQLIEQAHDSVGVLVYANQVVEKMKIELSVQAGAADDTFDLNKVDQVTSYTGTKHMGVVAEIAADRLDDSDNILEYTFHLADLQKSAEAESKTIVGATKIAFWMDKASADILGNKRALPTDTGYVWFGSKHVSSSWSDRSRALTITLDHAITPDDIENNLQIFSYFDFTGNITVDLNGGKCCAYCMDAKPK